MLTALEKFQQFEDLIMIQLSHVLLENNNKKKLIFKKFFVFITRLGDGFLYPLIILLSILIDSFQLKLLLSFLIGFSIERILYYLIKNTTKRERPFEKLKIKDIIILPPDKYSFPSGHTSSSFLFATLFSLFFPQLTIIVFTFAVLVAFSRIILNLHYPTDVLIGLQIGILTAIISWELTKLILL